MSRDWGEAGLCREDLPLACGLDLATHNTRRSHMSDELDYAQAGDGEQNDNTTVPPNAEGILCNLRCTECGTRLQYNLCKGRLSTRLAIHVWVPLVCQC